MTYNFNENIPSVPDLYGDLNGFLENFPADRLETFKQSKNLLNISANRDVCVAFGPKSELLTQSC